MHLALTAIGSFQPTLHANLVGRGTSQPDGFLQVAKTKCQAVFCARWCPYGPMANQRVPLAALCTLAAGSQPNSIKLYNPASKRPSAKSEMRAPPGRRPIQRCYHLRARLC